MPTVVKFAFDDDELFSNTSQPVLVGTDVFMLIWTLFVPVNGPPEMGTLVPGQS